MKLFAGIDPGNTGAIAIVNDEGDLVNAMAFKQYDKELDLNAIAAFVASYMPDLVVIEKVHSMPKQGVSSAFTFGKTYGMVLGICSAYHRKMELVPPTKWKKLVLADTDRSKEAAVAFVHRNYPTATLIPLGGRKPNHNLADAICLAHYGYINRKG